MYRVVIADDEQLICRLVQMLVDWKSLDMEVVGVASDGLAALELVEAKEPHILITDIRMPGCDGLELIERAKQLAPNLEIIIISGYAHFEYAQSAIRSGVGDYLLKPINKEALIATLRKLRTRCSERMKSTEVLENMQRSRQENMTLLRTHLVDDLLQKRFMVQSREELKNRYGYRAEAEYLQIYALKIDIDVRRSTPATIAVIQKRAQELFSQAMEQICPEHHFQFRGFWGYGIANLSAAQREPLRHALRNCLNQLDAQKFQFGNVEFSLGLSGAVSQPELLKDCIDEVQRAVKERLVEGTGKLLEPPRARAQMKTQPLLDRYLRTVDKAQEFFDETLADEAAETLLLDAADMGSANGHTLLELVITAYKSFVVRINLEEQDEICAEFEGLCDQCSSRETLYQVLLDSQRLQIQEARERHTEEHTRPIRQAKRYVQQHYHQVITLEDVCAEIGFSTSYFSMLFKKETGEGFSKYLTRVRIERAKELLQDTDLTIPEICNQVGYSDIKHFTTIFKKTTDLNPGQYRKLYS